MSLGFTPAPTPAPPLRRVLSHARMEASLLLRNGEQLLLALVIPIAALLAGHFFAERMGMSQQLVAPSVFALAIWSTGFTSTAIMTGFDRRYGVLKRLAATPLGRSGLVAGKVLATVSVIIGQLLVLGGVALATGWRPHASAAEWALALLGTVLAIAAFVSLALIMAGRLSAELTLALANLVFLIGAGAFGIFLPVSDYPAWARGIVRATPTGALGELLRGLAPGYTPWWPIPVLAVWAGAGALVARKVFRWMS